MMLIDERARRAGANRKDYGEQPSWVMKKTRMTLWYLGNSDPPQFDVTFGSAVNPQVVDRVPQKQSDQFTFFLEYPQWVIGENTLPTDDLADTLFRHLAERADED